MDLFMAVQYTISVDAGEHDRDSCPVSVSLDEDLGFESVKLIDTKNDDVIPAQLEGKTLSWILNGLKAHNQNDYVLSEGRGENTTHVSFDEREDAIDIRIGHRHFTTFRYAADQYRPYFFPVFGPEERQVTRGETSEDSADHVHHRSLYVAYGEVNHVDVWGEGKNSGRILHQNFTKKSDGPIVGQIHTNNKWVNASGDTLMSDMQNFSVYGLPDTGQIIDLDLTLIADSGDVFFGDTKEGGIITVRVNPQMNASASGAIENSFGGVNESETWGKRAAWCDYSGFVDGTHVGVAVLDHTSNPRYPTYWHVRNYGLMGTNIFGLGTFEGDKSKDGSYTLEQGGQMDFRFRVYIHSGNATNANVKTKYHDFVNPPSIIVS